MEFVEFGGKQLRNVKNSRVRLGSSAQTSVVANQARLLPTKQRASWNACTFSSQSDVHFEQINPQTVESPLVASQNWPGSQLKPDSQSLHPICGQIEITKRGIQIGVPDGIFEKPKRTTKHG
jgi:hypothetical protein